MVLEISNEYPWNGDLSENSLKYLAPTPTFRPGNITFDAKPKPLTLYCAAACADCCGVSPCYRIFAPRC
jgi:hypothetical protein